jgi:hypothetical protein
MRQEFIDGFYMAISGGKTSVVFVSGILVGATI